MLSVAVWEKSNNWEKYFVCIFVTFGANYYTAVRRNNVTL